MWLIYNLLLTLLFPLWVPWMWLRTQKRDAKPNWDERYGNYDIPKRKKPRVWFHAVSVGEVIAALPILREVRKLLPDHEIVLTVTTSSGYHTAQDKASGLFDYLHYFPIDVPRFALNAVQRVRPDVVVIMETELWMNFLWAAKVFDAKTMLVNGRISDRSFKRSKSLRFFYKALLKNMDLCLMQSERDANRITALGAGSSKVLGNCKFDQAVEGLDAQPDEWRKKLGISGEKPVVVVGSTRSEAEEQLVVSAIAELGFESVQVIHAPRHIERAPALSELVKSKGGSVALRSRSETGSYLILDTYGELANIYAIADVVVIGGGFDNLGGQNLIQPLAHGKPVIHGPHMQNFRDVADAAVLAGASVVAADSTELFKCLRKVLERPEIKEQMGTAASDLVKQNLGASRRYAEAIAEAASTSS